MVMAVSAGCSGVGSTSISPVPTSTPANVGFSTQSVKITVAPAAASVSPSAPSPTVGTTAMPTLFTPIPTLAAEATEVPTVLVTALPTLSPIPQPTSTAAPPEVELKPVCTFDEPQRRVSCWAQEQRGKSFKWTSSHNTGSVFSETYNIGFGWGEFLSQIQVQVEDCSGSKCIRAETSLELDMQPRGECPADFTGWFTTFPLPNLSEIYEVGPPGRILVGDYKGHGYFRVPGGQNAVDVRMPIDGTLYSGSVYLEPDEPQYLLFYRTACEGLTFLFDHVRQPVPAIENLFTDDPPVRDSSTYDVGPLEMKEGDLVATSIGTLTDGNAFLDFGVNDVLARLPTPQHPNAHGRFLSAVCLYTFFDPEIDAYLRSVAHPGLEAEEALCP